MRQRIVLTNRWRDILIWGLPLVLGAIALVELPSRGVLSFSPLLFLLGVVAFAAFGGGLYAGVVSALLASIYAAYFLSRPDQPFQYDATEGVRLVFFVVAALASALMTGGLRRELRASQAKLREQLEFRKAIDQSLDEGVYTLDHNGCLTYMNPAAERIFGWTEAELRGKVMHDVTHYQHPDGRPYPREECSGLRVLREGVVYRSEEDTFIRKDGRMFPVAYSSAPIEVNGRIVGVVVAVRDVTERKRIEASLKTSEERLGLIMDQLPAVVWTTDRDLKFTSATGSGLPNLGLSANKLLGTSLYDYGRGEDGSFAQIAAHQRALAGEQLAFEATWARRTWQAHVEPFYDATGEVIGCLGIAIDVTERKRAEDALRASEAKLRLITGQLPAHIWTTDTELRVTSVSGAAGTQLGISLSNYIGKQLTELIDTSAAHLAASIRAHRRALSGEPAGYELDTRERQFDARVEPLRDSTGQIVGVLGMALDITARKRNERRLQTQYDVSRVLSEAESLEVAAPKILKALGESLEWEYGGLWLTDEHRNVLRCVETWQAPSTQLEEFVARTRSAAFAPGEGLPGRVLSEQSPQWIADFTHEQSLPRLQVALAEGLRASLAVPIRIDGRVGGVLEFFSDDQVKQDPDVLNMIHALAHQIGPFIERKQAEAALRESEVRKAAILESSLDAIITIDGSGRIVEFNPAAERIFGHARQDVLGHEIADIAIPPSLRERHRFGLARYLRTGEGSVLNQRVEMSALRADGTEFPAELALTPIGLDGPPMFTIYVRDITERKLAEEALRVRASQQAAIAALGQRAVATPDLADLLPYAIQVVVQTLGSELCKVLELLPEQDCFVLRAGLGWKEGTIGRATVAATPDTHAGYTLRSRTPVVVEDVAAETRFRPPELLTEHGVVSTMSVVIYHRNGAFGVLEADATSHRLFSNDDINFLQAVANILTAAIQRKEFEDELAAGRTEAARREELDRLRRQFVLSVSHELRTPLTVAQGGLGMLDTSIQDRLRVDERKLLGASRRNVERLRMLIDDLLVYNQFEAGTLRLKLERTDVREVVANVLPIIHPPMNEKDQKLELDLPEPLPAEVDRSRLLHALTNVFTYIHERMAPGTAIGMSGRHTEQGLQLSITSRGSGLAIEDADTIFQHFHRLGLSEDGSGVGLAVANTLIQLHGGQVSVDQSNGKGARFQITLPLVAGK